MKTSEHSKVWKGATAAVLSAAMVLTFIPSASFAETTPADQNSTPAATETQTAAKTIKDVTLGVGDNDSMRYLTWESNSGADESVRYIEASKLKDENGTKAIPADGATVVKADKRADSTGQNKDGSESVYGKDGFSNYHAKIEGLKENTEYAYQIGSDANWSQIYYTTTQAKASDKKFSFVFAGDPQIGASKGHQVDKDTEGWKRTMDDVDSWFGKDVEFLYSAGDQINNYDPEEDEYEGYFAPKTTTSLPMAVNVGNHDNGNMKISAYSDHYTVPSTVDSNTTTIGDQSGDYWFEYDGALFISLNSNSMSTAAHKAYIEKAIKDYTAQYGQPTWKIVTFHHSVYSTATHTTDKDILQRREELPKVLSEEGIDAVLMGHDHVYTRTYMMQGTTPVTDKARYTAENGDDYGSISNPQKGEVLYVTANSASGSKFYTMKDMEFPFAAVKNQENIPNITKVDITDGSFKVTTYRTGEGNTVKDVVDTFTINKTVRKDVNLGVGASDADRAVTWESNSNKDESVRVIEASKLTDNNGVKAFPADGATVVKAVKQADSTGQNKDGSDSAYGKDGFSNYHARLNGVFKDNTEYAYQLGTDGDWSQIYYTTTQQKTGDKSFSFVFAGDPQIGASKGHKVASDTEGWKRTMDDVNSWFGKEIEFIYSAGDQINNYDPEEDEYEGYFGTSTMTSLPMAVNVGNHDNGNMKINAFSDHYTVPENTDSATQTIGDQSGDYWFEYDGALLISLNSNSMSTAAHKAFMEKAIKDFTAKYGEPAWKIVTFHHSVYSTATHTSDEDILQRREQLPPVFSELGIDVVLMGHDHVYTRSYMMQGTTPVTDKSRYTAVNGDDYGSISNPQKGEVLYVTANSASGSKFYTMKDMEFPFAAVKNQENIPNITKVDVKDGSFTVTTYRTGKDNTVKDVVDTFTINKNGESAELQFKDVQANDWFYNAVKTVFQNKLMNGTSADTFEPNTTLNRAMFATILYNMEGKPAADKSAGFTDVADGQWYTNAVNWAAANKVVAGTGDNKFSPDQSITREQMAAMLYRYAQYKNTAGNAKGDLSAFKDAASVSSWAKDAVEWAVGNKIINGMGDGQLNPQGTATRAEAAQIVSVYSR